jgi:deazaflavin-dependent oxidoreductase (nitroreductase family)
VVVSFVSAWALAPPDWPGAVAAGQRPNLAKSTGRAGTDRGRHTGTVGEPDFDHPEDPSSDWAAQHVRDYVATAGKHPTNGHDWVRGAPVLLLTTVGHRTGRTRRTPLIYGRDGDRYLVVASKGGSDEARVWYRNLLADPRVRVQVRGDVVAGRARNATAAEQERLWPEMARIWPDYDNYQARTARSIPVVVIEPEG